MSQHSAHLRGINPHRRGGSGPGLKHTKSMGNLSSLDGVCSLLIPCTAAVAPSDRLHFRYILTASRHRQQPKYSKPTTASGSSSSPFFSPILSTLLPRSYSTPFLRLQPNARQYHPRPIDHLPECTGDASVPSALAVLRVPRSLAVPAAGDSRLQPVSTRRVSLPTTAALAGARLSVSHAFVGMTASS